MTHEILVKPNAPEIAVEPGSSGPGGAAFNTSPELSQPPGPAEYRKYHNGQVVSRFLVPAEKAAEIDAALTECGWSNDAHGNSRPVVVWGEIAKEEYAKRIRELSARAITDPYFPSALAASFHLGYKWNAVRQALGRAKQRGEDTAVVGGVPFKWADEIGGI